MANRIPTRYEVMPRYSGGSPAMVDKATAERIASQEKEMFEAYRLGWYGDEGKARADNEGLAGIVVTSRDGETYIDYLTGTDYGTMPYSAIRNPQQLVITQHRSTVCVWFRRQLLCEFIMRKSDRLSEHEGTVLRALRTAYPNEISIADACILWHERREVN